MSPPKITSQSCASSPGSVSPPAAPAYPSNTTQGERSSHDVALGVDEHLEVDEYEDPDSAYGDSIHSDLTSLASSVARGIFENGRRYHSYGKEQYAFPNDEAEMKRLDMQHTMMTHLLGDRLYLAPIGNNPQKVLDLGTGTGIWAIDFADEFPAAEVIGTDLSAIQPSWVPPNCRFEIDDAEADWTWPEESFDYIHNRNFVCAIRDWPKLIQKTYQYIKPGGYVEWQEKHPFFLSDDGSLTQDSAIFRWGKSFFEASITFGADSASPRLLKQRMEEAGFVDVEERILKLPVGPWPRDPRLKKVGIFESVNMTEGIQGLTIMLFTRCLHWTPEEVEVFLADVRKEVKNKTIHSYYHFYVVYGRKPT